MHVSVGIARADADSTVDTLMRAADGALYEAEQAGGGRVAYTGAGSAT